MMILHYVELLNKINDLKLICFSIRTYQCLQVITQILRRRNNAKHYENAHFALVAKVVVTNILYSPVQLS